jgi:ferrous iron transport protein A
MPLAAIRKLLRPALVSVDAAAALPAREPAPAFSGALSAAATGQACQVTAVTPPPQAPDWGRWLAEIGFIAGEPAMVTARSPWGDGALVVRIGSSQFALRREEADCITVCGL